ADKIFNDLPHVTQDLRHHDHIPACFLHTVNYPEGRFELDRKGSLASFTNFAITSDLEVIAMRFSRLFVLLLAAMLLAGCAGGSVSPTRRTATSDAVVSM